MTKDEVANALIEKIKESYQLTSGEEPDIDRNTAPFEELEYFDSLLGSEVGIELEDELKCEFQKIKNAFEKADLEGITIDDMAELILDTNKE